MRSENDIKKTFLPFLKEFYKYRYEYRPESVQTNLDNLGAGGIIADGMVSFQKEDGTPFVCTYEATSADKADEVKYTRNTLYFIWDCLAFGAMVAAGAYAIAYSLRFPWLVSLQWTGNLGFILGMGITGFFAWYYSMLNWKKYRYIYAIEQFKQYFADEQWIALADDVFPAPTDPYLQELKNQCVYNGFGLALVPDRGEIRVLVTPSRLGIYGKDRRMVQWVTRKDWYQAMSQNVRTITQYGSMPDTFTQAWNKIWQPVRYLMIDPFRKFLRGSAQNAANRSDPSFNRYMHGHSIQKWLFLLALATMTPLIYRVLTIREDDVRDVVEYPETNPEDQYGYLYEGDAAPARDPRGIPKQYPEPATPPRPEPEIQTIDLSGTNDQEDVPTINLSGDTEESPAASADPCTLYRNQKGWVIEDNSYANQTFASERAAALRRKGVAAEVIPKQCLGDGAGYIVLIGEVYATESTANTKADNFSKAMERYGVFQGELFVRRLH